MSDIVENFKYLSQSLEFEDDRIKYDRGDGVIVNVMMTWENPIMSASAEYVCQNGGDIIEFGFGMGIASNYIQSQSINSHTICEIHPQVIEKAEAWAEGKSNVTLITGSWVTNKDELGTYDGIFYDADYTSDLLHFSGSVTSLSKSGTLLTFFNPASSSYNYLQIPVDGYDEVSVDASSVDPPPDYWNTSQKIYYMPKREF